VYSVVNGLLSQLNAIEAYLDARKKFQNNNLHNGNGDAYRHAYWGALMVLHSDYQWAEKWGNAHENGALNNPESQKRMDLYNNRVGRMIAFEFLSRMKYKPETLTDKFKLEDKLSELVMSKVDAGQMVQLDSYGYSIPTNSKGKVKYDWYRINRKDAYNNIYDIYVSETAATIGNSNKAILARVSKNNSSYKEYSHSTYSWNPTGAIYARAPGQPGEVTVAQDDQEGAPKQVYDLREEIGEKQAGILDLMYSYTGIELSELTTDDIIKIGLGVTNSIDDNLFFGLIKEVTSTVPPIDSYYYLKSKSFTDSCFVNAFTIADVGSAAAAAQAFSNSGISGALAIASSPTGAGAVGFGAVAAEELARGVTLSAFSFFAGRMVDRSVNNLQSSVSGLENSTGYKVRNIQDDILDKAEGYPNSKGGHTLRDHVSRTNNELKSKSLLDADDATSFESKRVAITSVKQNIRKNAKEIEEWLKDNSVSNRKTINYDHQFVTGYGVKYPSGATRSNLTKSRVVLIKDSRMPEGFYVLTSFPII
jgi:hypothetical protein